jgi:hypothetical protein
MLDALPLGFVASALASREPSSYTITKDFASTIRLSAQASTSITLKGGVTATLGQFMVGGSTTFTQTNSTTVSNAITLRRTTAQQITTPAPGSPDNTVFIGLRRPQIELTGNEMNLRFRFLKALDTYALTAADLKNNPAVRSLFLPQTIQSILNTYPLLADPSGASLVKPRFKLRLSILLSAGVRDLFTFTSSDNTTFSEAKTSTTSVTITESFKFKNKRLEAAFEANQKLDVTQTSVQEVSTTKVIGLSTTLNRASLGISKVFYDRVFKTFVIVDAGAPVMSGQPVVNGRITDAKGVPIPGAVVKLEQDNTEYAAVSDANGNYTIATAGGDRLAAGNAQITCGNIVRSVVLGGTANAMNLSGVDALSARQLQCDVGGIIA